MRRTRLAVLATPAVLAACLAMAAGRAQADQADLPMMDPNMPVQCRADESGQRWRLQCHEATKRCLYAPDAALDMDGKPLAPLERARACMISPERFSLDELRARGYEPVRALPDAPHGWMRDARGRVFQVDFDLARRLYLGVRYAPRWRSATSDVQRAGLDFGLLSFEHSTARTRHRLRLVEGRVFLSPFSGRLVLVHYDMSHRRVTPLFRITTFFGKPRRHDGRLNVGAWVEAGDLELIATPAGEAQLTRYATVNGTVDLWQSADLSSFVRLRGGAGFEAMELDGEPGPNTAITPGGALEANLTLDRSGFHHLNAALSYENPLYLERHPILGSASRRMEARMAYELIVLAINDQPLSLHLGVGASRRDDIQTLPGTWEATADAGLRFSLWAPPRAP